MLPFTREEFFNVFATYNEQVWPAQALLVALGLAMVAAVWFQRRPRWVGWALGAMWGWMGIAYHMAFFSAINPAAFLFGAAFVLQAILLARGTQARTLEFGAPGSTAQNVIGGVLVAYALVGYPLLAYLSGQSYPAMPTFGLPCPTTIFTFGLMAWTVRRPPWAVLAIPLAWSVIGTSAAGTLHVPEDWGLPFAAAAVLVLRLRPQRRGRMDRLAGVTAK